MIIWKSIINTCITIIGPFYLKKRSNSSSPVSVFVAPFIIIILDEEGSRKIIIFMTFICRFMLFLSLIMTFIFRLIIEIGLEKQSADGDHNVSKHTHSAWTASNMP